jgi:UDP-N-acetylglucosamine 2-epimerase (non-hydrolysing)
MKVMTIVGTRPEIIKMSEIIKKLDKYTDHVFVHTGQNYDYELNEIFYEDLELRKPDYYLNVVGDTLGSTIGNVISKTEEVLLKEKPDAVVILGDTNSALGGIIAKRLKIPLFHLEAGNRCFDDNVPEEQNRRILDHISDINMVYTENSRRYLLDEGVAKQRIFIMGSPMLEIFNRYLGTINNSTILLEQNLERGEYFLVSIHRDENTEIKQNLDTLLDTLNTIADQYELPIIVSTHPRLRKKLEGRKLNKNIRLCKPFGFFDYVKLQLDARCVISDSGTISEESSLLGFPAITVRNAIERPEAIDTGSILMTGVDKDNILRCIQVAVDSDNEHIPYDYDIGNCSERVLKVILGFTGYVNKYVWQKSL